MSLGPEISNSFKNLHDAAITDKVKAYSDYAALLRENAITPDDLTAAANPASQLGAVSIDAIKWARNQQAIYPRTISGEPLKGHFLKGSGIVLVAYRGIILASDYKDGGTDLVEKQYPGYQSVAALKLGRAMLINHSVGPFSPSGLKDYRVLEELLASADEPGLPGHHLGYESHMGGDLVAGASGMLPAEWVHDALLEGLDVQNDRYPNTEGWPLDTAAGAVDAKVGGLALSKWRPPKCGLSGLPVDLASFIADCNRLSAAGVNIH